jgi:hypothetical protein
VGLPRWVALVAVGLAGLSVAGCTDQQPTAQAALANGQTLYLEVTLYLPYTGFKVLAFAEVPGGTPATLSVAGPVSWNCSALFYGHPASGPSWQHGALGAIGFRWP